MRSFSRFLSTSSLICSVCMTACVTGAVPRVASATLCVGDFDPTQQLFEGRELFFVEPCELGRRGEQRRAESLACFDALRSEANVLHAAILLGRPAHDEPLLLEAIHEPGHIGCMTREGR